MSAHEVNRQLGPKQRSLHGHVNSPWREAGADEVPVTASNQKFALV